MIQQSCHVEIGHGGRNGGEELFLNDGENFTHYQPLGTLALEIIWYLHFGEARPGEEEAWIALPTLVDQFAAFGGQPLHKPHLIFLCVGASLPLRKEAEQKAECKLIQVAHIPHDYGLVISEELNIRLLMVEDFIQLFAQVLEVLVTGK